MAVVNGLVWPAIQFRRRPYRLRLLNGFNARTVNLLFLSPEPSCTAALRIYVVGADAGRSTQPRATRRRAASSSRTPSAGRR